MLDAAASPPLHPEIAGLACLLGSWTGRGSGSYPTIDSFEYAETVTFTHVGKPFLAYTQRTTHAADGRPLHAEAGYVRSDGTAHLEFVLAHPNGLTELDEGTIDTTGDVTRLTLRSVSVVGSSTAKPVRAVERDVTVDGDRLHYVLRMSAMGLAMTHHLEATLVRVA